MSTKSEFTCNNKSLATFLIRHGSNLITIKNGIFVFEKDDEIKNNVEIWRKLQEKCMF